MCLYQVSSHYWTKKGCASLETQDSRCRLTSVTSVGFATCMLAFVLIEASMLPFPLKKRYRISPEETFVYQIWALFLLAGRRCEWKWQRRRKKFGLGNWSQCPLRWHTWDSQGVSGFSSWREFVRPNQTFPSSPLSVPWNCFGKLNEELVLKTS